MNAIARTEQADNPPATTNESSAVLMMIERAASNPNADIDKMERLLQMHERMLQRQAATEFDAALAAMQPELPSIGERGNAAGRYTYALWEDINQVIKPILQRHGFALSFRTDFTNGISITGVLSHRAGHREQTTMTLPADKSGNKNDVQAVASSVSYGKRYTAGALLNLTSHGEDDDAFSGGGNERDRAAADKQDRWLEAIAHCETLEAYEKVRADCIADYGIADKVPNTIRHAFVARKAKIEGAA